MSPHTVAFSRPPLSSTARSPAAHRRCNRKRDCPRPWDREGATGEAESWIEQFDVQALPRDAESIERVAVVSSLAARAGVVRVFRHVRYASALFVALPITWVTGCPSFSAATIARSRLCLCGVGDRLDVAARATPSAIRDHEVSGDTAMSATVISVFVPVSIKSRAVRGVRLRANSGNP
jgi:hypothetical protein